MLTVPLTAVTVASSVNVTMPPGGGVGSDRPVANWATVGPPGHTAPPLAAQVRDFFSSPAASTVTTTAPSTALAPALVTTIVYLVDPAAVTLLVPLVIVRLRSTVVPALSVSDALLFAGVGSFTPAGAVTVAMFVTLPPAAVTVAPIVSVTLPPNGSAGMASPASTWATVGLAGQVAPPAAAQTTVVFVSPAAAGSVTIALFAASGPALLTTTV